MTIMMIMFVNFAFNLIQLKNKTKNSLNKKIKIVFSGDKSPKPKYQ